MRDPGNRKEFRPSNAQNRSKIPANRKQMGNPVAYAFNLRLTKGSVCSHGSRTLGCRTLRAFCEGCGFFGGFDLSCQRLERSPQGPPGIVAIEFIAPEPSEKSKPRPFQKQKGRPPGRANQSLGVDLLQWYDHTVRGRHKKNAKESATDLVVIFLFPSDNYLGLSNGRNKFRRPSFATIV